LIIFLEPAENDRCVEAAGICENDFHERFFVILIEAQNLGSIATLVKTPIRGFIFLASQSPLSRQDARWPDSQDGCAPSSPQLHFWNSGIRATFLGRQADRLLPTGRIAASRVAKAQSLH
jgi:hypothetical protein